jgi:predicted nucleic-acid-binding protein
MNMDSPSKSQDDIFVVCKENAAKFFNEIEKSSPVYVQSAINLHQKNIEAWKNVINSTIAMEQEYAKKAGLQTPVPQATKNSIREFTEGVIKAYAAQNKIAVDAADATNRAINTLNENTTTFSALNKNMLDSMLLVINQQKKT